MAGFANRWRSNVLGTLTGNDDGRPYWVDKIEHGDDAGYFGADSAAWVVHGSMPTMVAGIRALLMQTLHPGAMAGVHDWSRYQADALGRLSGTVQWLVTVTYSDTALAREETARVERFHDRVRGTYVDAGGTERPYSASDPELLRWVHLVVGRRRPAPSRTPGDGCGTALIGALHSAENGEISTQVPRGGFAELLLH